MNQVPKEWTAMIAVLREAQVAQDAARLPNISDAARDEEIARYARACDALVANLGALSERQVLGQERAVMTDTRRYITKLRYSIVHQPPKGYAVADPEGRITTEWYDFRPAAERQRSELQMLADRAKKHGVRACLCCGSAFDSEGIHNRLCQSCRRRDAEASPHGVASRTSSLSRTR